MTKNKLKIVLAFTIVSVVLLWLSFSAFNKNMQYYIDIKELHQLGDKALNKGLRVKGFLVPGSLVKTDSTLSVTFVIEQDGHQLNVRYDEKEPLPDTFKDNSEVVVEGKMNTDGYFDATFLMAKCPSTS